VTSTGAQQAEVISEADQIREHRWAPDGKSLAYVVRPNFDLVTIGVDGTGRKVIATGAQQIDWSADGTKLAYTSLGNIYVVNADGTGQKQLTTAVGAQHPRWSPDGTRIAFDRGVIYVVGSDGTNETTLNTSMGSASSPAWAPDGAKIAAVKDGTGIYWSDADGSNLNGPFGLRPRRDELEWSPDGSVFVFTNQPSVISDTGISSIKSDGTDEKVLVPAMGSVPRFGPAWSPKGTRISYTRSPPTVGGATVWTMDAAGQGGAQLVKGFEARWNPTCNE
jgi:TolB protein